MKKYKTLIIDDKVEDLNLLKTIINTNFPILEIVAEASNVQTGIQKYLKTTPEILLLDVNLENDTIFSFIDQLENKTVEIILISSHNNFAVSAVKYDVTGYVLKPLKIKDLKKAIQKAIFNLSKKNISQTLVSSHNQNSIAYSNMVPIPGINDVELIDTDEIEFLEADGKYTVVHLTNQKKKVSSKNIGEYESLIDPRLFYRIHHRYLINVTKIIRIHKTGRPTCELDNKTRVPIAKRRLDSLYQFLNIK